MYLCRRVMSLHLKTNCYFYETRKLLTSIQSVLRPTVTYIHLSFQFCRPIQYSKCYSYNLKTNKPFNSKLNNTILFIILPIYYFIHVCAESSKGRYVLYIDSAKKDKFIYYNPHPNSTIVLSIIMYCIQTSRSWCMMMLSCISYHVHAPKKLNGYLFIIRKSMYTRHTIAYFISVHKNLWNPSSK